ncbi:MAG: T9SS type A sorting domain-containing protein [Bacteroidia bacterium]
MEQLFTKSILGLFTLFCFFLSPEKKFSEREEPKKLVSDADEQFYMQRSYPDSTFDLPAYEAALNEVRLQVKNTAAKNSSVASWTYEGPGNIGGRINCIAVDPGNHNIIYAGCATGGIFKTIDGGISWAPIFDNATALAIGCIEFEPGNSNTIYAGTGDPNISGYPFIGDGIYKSTDAGQTWTNLGLAPARIITKIKIDPTNVNTIYASAMGNPFVKTNDRGVYKSTDGGLTWQQSLFISDSAGVIDMLMNPQNPNIVYAAGWNRIRNNQQSLISGPGAKIYVTTNGGATWNILAGGLPQNDQCRIGLTMSGTSPNIIYASYVDVNFDIQGIYKTTNSGGTWTSLGASGLGGVQGGFGWYFGRLQVDPANDNELYFCAVGLYKSTDGGNSWFNADNFSQMHADKHDIFYVTSDTVLIGTDGGMYRTDDGGSSWNDVENIPNTQFYRCASDPNQNAVYAGGAQDNGTNTGNASTFNTWQHIFGADGFQPVYHPTDPNIMYAEYQNGEINVSTDGGFSFFDATNGIDATDRRNWDMQYIMSSGSSDVLYTGTYRVYINTNGPFANWTAISNDLTDGNIFGDRYHTISTVAESAINTNHLYAGTSDGNVWRSLDGGTIWSNVTASLPDRYVTCIKASPNTASMAYVSHSGYKYNDFIPHIHKTTDNGTSWTDISGDLPQISINDILTYNGNDAVLFVATDGGVYGTWNSGVNWIRIGNNMPVIPVYDLDVDVANNRIVAATHARGMMTFPIDSFLLATGIENNLSVGNHVKMFPNPANEFINVSGLNFKVSGFSIYDINGKIVIDGNPENKNKVSISVKELKTGIYFLKLTNGKEKFVKRFLKM